MPYQSVLHAMSSATRRTNQIVRLIRSAPPLTEAHVKRITEAAGDVQRLNEREWDQK